MADGSDETNKGSSRPNPNDWAAINSVTDMPKIQARHRSQPEFRVPQSAPEPLATIDLKPRRHRSYSGFVALLVLCVLLSFECVSPLQVLVVAIDIYFLLVSLQHIVYALLYHVVQRNFFHIFTLYIISLRQDYQHSLQLSRKHLHQENSITF